MKGSVSEKKPSITEFFSIPKAITYPYGHVGSYLANRLRRLNRCSSAGRRYFSLSTYLCPLEKSMNDQTQRSRNADALYPFTFKSRGFGAEIGVVFLPV